MLQEEILEYIEKIFKNKETRVSFLNLVEAFNPSLKSLFLYKNDGDEDATIYGLLNSFLMTGDKIRVVSIEFLNQFKENYNKKNKNKKIEDK